jgi:SAM-dependent methyltransferase
MHIDDPEPGLPAGLFARVDESDDALFYQAPRLVTHIDPGTIAALTQYYAQMLPDGLRLLDLMSSWVSHLPAQRRYERVVGLGMNAEELRANERLTARVVQDLNRDCTLPFDARSFDAVLIAVSVQYLVRPVDVFREIGRVLCPGGRLIVAMSHRCFPTKAVRAFHQLGGEDRIRLVAAYFELAGGFTAPLFVDRSPPHEDPLWIVTATTADARGGIESGQ